MATLFFQLKQPKHSFGCIIEKSIKIGEHEHGTNKML